MKPKCGDPIDFSEQDWSRFDFTRWSFEGVPVDEPSAAIAGLAQQLFASPEWQQNFSATLPALKTAVRQHYVGRVEELKSREAELAQSLDERTAAAKKQAAALQERNKSAAAPPVLTADPNTYQLGAKVLADDTRLGLPGLTVRLVGPEKRVLAEASTDQDGNAVLILEKNQADALHKFEVGMEVAARSGKVVYKEDHAVCPRSNHTETFVAAVKPTKDVKPHAEIAAQIKAERDARLAEVRGKTERLKADYNASHEVLQCRLQQAQKIIAEIDKEQSGTVAPPGPSKLTPGRTTKSRSRK